MRWVEKDNIAYKIYKKHVKFLINELKKDKTITMKDLTIKLNKKFNIKLSRSHISKTIRNNNITLKQTRLRHQPILRYNRLVDINKQLKEFYKIIKKRKINNLICIDETSLNSYEVRKHYYNKSGKRCIIKTESKEVFKKYTGIFAISIKGCIGYKIYKKGGIDSDRLLDFLNEFIVNKYKKKTIILDNASSHRNHRVKELIKQNNYLLYSIPYQHFTNSIEQYFSLLKSKLRKQKGIGYNQLKRNIKRIIKKIPKSTYKNIFKGSYDRTRKYVSKKSTKLRTLKKYK